ncbi:MAG: tripartite tricarboxylate transporter substrate-binding protein [Haloferacaceae archaeon]
MARDPNHRANRRTFLKTTGVAGVGLLAGCSGDGGGDGGDGSDGSDGGGGDGSDGGDDGGDGGDGGDEVEFPETDVRLLIPYGPGGGYDGYTRLTAPYLQEYLPGDHSVQPQNVEGAGGVIATEETYSADPDGHTQFIANLSSFAVTQLVEDVDYDLTEMTWFAQIAQDLRGIAVSKETGIETFSEYVEAVQNDELKFYSTGAGDANHYIPVVLGEMGGFYDADRVTENLVVYDGRGEGFQGVLSGDVHVFSGTYHSILPFVDQEDAMNMILVFDNEDQPPDPTPDAETFATAEPEISDKQAIIDTVTGRRLFGGPPDIPDDVTQIIRDAYDQALNDDDFLAEADEAERPVNYLSGEESADAVSNMIGMWEDNPDLLDAIFGE